MNTATHQKRIKKNIFLIVLFISSFYFRNYGEINETLPVYFVYQQDDPATFSLQNLHNGTLLFTTEMKQEPDQTLIDQQLVFLRKIPGFLSMKKSESGHLIVLTTDQVLTNDREHILLIASRICGYIGFVISE